MNQGKPCRTCGSTDRYKSGNCRPCSVKSKKDFNERNPDRNRQSCRAWYKANKHKAKTYYRSNKRNRFLYLLKRNYGLTLETYEAMLKSQKGACDICRKPFSGPPFVDHCHKTGLVRGLLCRGCNTGLGFFQDDPLRLVAAAVRLCKKSGDKL